SVTQHFNTTTSMGRLTLNILLSFAQFEREVTGERIRDKIAASKKKGLCQPSLGYEPATPDTGLVRLLVRANAIRDQVLADRSLTLEEIAKAEGIVPSYATRLFRLTLFSPDIVSAILSGSHPPELTARSLMDDTRLPLDWNEQRRRLGFVSAH